MKLAIIGHSPLALEAALRFHLHGAALTWYQDREDPSLFESPALSADAYTSEHGHGVLKELNQCYAPEIFSWREWRQRYEKPLTDYLRAHQEVKSDEVVSVAKRFLAPGEAIPGRSRFLDLFRIIYRVNPKDFIEQQKDASPETYQRLTEEFINSLASAIEMYQDYDLVLDLRGDLSRASASAAGRALGEGRSAAKVSYALEALALARGLAAAPDDRELALVGSDSLAAEILLTLADWLADPRSLLFIVTTEDEPFTEFLARANPATAEKLRALFDRIDDEFAREVDAFTRKLRDWQELDDFVQAKIPRPAEPVPRVNFFSGHNVTAIDELIDRRRLFLTLERPEFRHGKKHPQNNELELKTVGCDRILVAHARKDRSLLALDPGEPGHFAATPARPNVRDAWNRDLEHLEGIEDEIFKLFTPVDSH
jgi:hypothetical protein